MTKLFVGSVKEIEAAHEAAVKSIPEGTAAKIHMWPNPYIVMGDDSTFFVLTDRLQTYLDGGNKYDAIEGAVTEEQRTKLSHAKPNPEPAV